MMWRKLLKSGDTRDAANARAALRDASDDVRESLHALDVELAREHNESLVMQIVEVVRDCRELLKRATKLLHSHKRRNT